MVLQDSLLVPRTSERVQRSTVRQGTGDHDCSSLAHCPLIAQRAGPANRRHAPIG